jgi:hypothetical protein
LTEFTLEIFFASTAPEAAPAAVVDSCCSLTPARILVRFSLPRRLMFSSAREGIITLEALNLSKMRFLDFGENAA